MKWLPSYALLVLVLTGCEREERAFYQETSGKELVVALSPLSPGDGKPQVLASPDAETYQKNAWHLSEGKRLFTWFNCSGCHGNGGGGSGPPLMDSKWIYGGNIENIVATIREGRPNGMPSFRGKITDNQMWQIAAFVRSLSGNIRKDVAPSRNDDLNAHPAENRLPRLTPITGGLTPPSAAMPQ
jgi:cytochrome c oxidase cbb3-type subunit 3